MLIYTGFFTMPAWRGSEATS